MPAATAEIEEFSAEAIPAVWKPAVNPWIVALSVMLATFMEVLDTSIAAVALPYIAGSLSASTDEATWVLTSYLVSNAIVLPASTWFALRYGRKRFLIACVAIFTISSFLCGAATSLAIILIARALQGAGGGALQPLSQAILLESFPPQKRGQAMAVFALGVVVAPVLGPTLGGWLTDHYSWRWAFYINVPIGILAMLLISRFVEDPPYVRDAKPGRLDAIGLGLLAIWLGALQLILDKGQEDDWFGAMWIRWAAVILVTCLIAFIVRQLRHDKPLVNLRIFLDRNFTLGCVLIGLFGAAIYGVVTILPLFYQTLIGYDATAAGFVVSTRGIGAIVAMPIIGMLTAKLDNRWLTVFGFLVFGICCYQYGQATLDIGPSSLFWAITISGFGMGFVFVPLSTLAVGSLPNEQIGNASGLYNLLRNIGGGIGISIVNTLLSRHEQLHRTELSHSLNASNPAFQQQLHSLAQGVGAGSDPVSAVDRAYKLIEGTLTRQALLWSYVDDFRYLALLCFICIPIALLMKKIAKKPGHVMIE